MEGMMGNQRMVKLEAAIILIFFTILVGGCAGGPALQQEVTTEYLLSTAGFEKWEVNEKTPARQALLSALPAGTISTYMRNGRVFHAYPDNLSKVIYVGDEAAYQRYLSLSQGRQMCRQVTGADQVQFWSCMEEFQESGAGPGGR
jgi:hypothetical protein